MWRKKSILLIDDNNNELRTFITALNELGIAYNCSHAKNAEQGLRILQGLLPDFIFLNIDINAGDNFERFAEIKKMKKLRDVPVIIYTNRVNDEVRKKALKTGAVVFIRKTGSIKALTETLKMILTPTQREIQLLYS